MHLIAWIEQRVQELRADDYLMANASRSEMVHSDRSDWCLNWLCHVDSGLFRRLVGECERLVVTVPLVYEVVFFSGVRVRRLRER